MLPLMSKGRVLVLDDDASIQRLVSTLLKRDGYRVTVVNSGRAAIEELKKKPFDVMLLDIMMPHEGGMTVMKHLKEHASGELKRVILLTATPAAVLKTVEKDVFAIVRKPFVAEELLETVRRANG
jgi:CheY-like chemotaxis protein